ETITNHLFDFASLNHSWGIILKSIDPFFRIDLIYRLSDHFRDIEKQDWLNLFNSNQFNFRESWMYLCALLISLIASLIAIVQILAYMFWRSEIGLHVLMATAVLVIVLFWFSVHHEIKKNLEPEAFIKLGLGAGMTFWNIMYFMGEKYVRKSRNVLPLSLIKNISSEGSFKKQVSNTKLQLKLWQGVCLGYEGLTSMSKNMIWAIGFGAISMSLIWFFSVTESAGSIASIFGSVAIAIAMTMTGANLKKDDINLETASFLTFLSLIVGYMIGFLGGLSAENTDTGSLLGACLGFWIGLIIIVDYRAGAGAMWGVFGAGLVFCFGILFEVKTITLAIMVAGAIGLCFGYGIRLFKEAYENKQLWIESIPLWKKLLALLAFPFYCWFPITTIFSLLGLKNLLTYLNTPHPWPIAIAIWLTLFTLCCLLWVWGQRKDRAARNPLHGILDDYYPQYKMQSNK
ncbi:MAG: hypothetical protein AAGG51_29300, partial [Cyanobacteria bacterium P01_G01_bin.54]